MTTLDGCPGKTAAAAALVSICSPSAHKRAYAVANGGEAEVFDPGGGVGE